MEKKPNENWPGVILHNGRPYVLKKLDRKGIDDPCLMCDLRQLCLGRSILTQFYNLCTGGGRDESWYYEEDWTVYDKQILEFVYAKFP